MRICNNLNTSICFNYKEIGITYCTLTNASNGKGWPQIPDEVFDGKRIDWEKFFDNRKKEIDSIKNNRQREECQNCNQIEEKDFNDDKKIHYILLSSWQICQSNCIYCLGHVPPRSEKSPDYKEFFNKFEEPYDILEIIKDMVDKKILADDVKFDFAGGEPTLYPKFNDIVEYLIDNNYKNIVIHTNNIIYSKVIEKGIKQKAISLVISIDAGTKKCHEKIKRVKSYNIVWKNFKKYSKANRKGNPVRLCAKYVIVPDINDSEKEMLEFIKQAKRHGATEIAINTYNQLLNNMNYDKELMKHLIKLTDYAVEAAIKYKIKPITFPNIEFVYDYFGFKRPCSELGNIFGEKDV